MSNKNLYIYLLFFALFLSGCLIQKTDTVKHIFYPEISLDRNNHIVKIIDCNTIYPNKQYELQLFHIDVEDLYSEKSNTIFKLFDKQTTKEVIADSIFSFTGEVLFEDFNNDNIKDILIHNSSDVRSNWTYHLYLVDTIYNKLTKVKGFEELKNPTFNKEYNLIESFVISGTNWTSFYTIENNTIVNLGHTIYWEDEDGKSQKEIICNTFQLQAQEKRYGIYPRALDIGVYDYSKAKKCPYKIYYNENAEGKFNERLMSDERLRSVADFGEYITQEDGSTIYFREQEAYEYCPKLEYVMITGGHGFVSAYDLRTLEEIFVNPSSYVYSPSGKYRFGTFEYDGMSYYIEVKEGDKYTPYFICHNSTGFMTGVYWADDETIHYLSEKERADGSKYSIGYSTKFYEMVTDYLDNQYMFIRHDSIPGLLVDSVSNHEGNKVAAKDLRGAEQYYHALTPYYPLSIKRTYYDEVRQIIERGETPPTFFETGGGLIPVGINYVAEIDNEKVIIDSQEKFRQIFAPVETVQEAIAFAYIFTDSYPLYNLDYLVEPAPIEEPWSPFEIDLITQDTLWMIMPHHIIKEPGWNIYTPEIVSSYAKYTDEGYELLLYHYKLFGCSHPYSRRVIKVSFDGMVEILEEQEAFERWDEVGLCID